MKKRIGLLLSSNPTWGGTFQYNQIIIEAVMSLPKDYYEIDVIYFDNLWKEYLSQFEFKKIVEIQPNEANLIKKGIKILSIPLLRRLCKYIDPVCKAISDANCDCWVFPSQDAYSYEVNIRSISVIHDLMHRYENFPENSDRKEYFIRERLFSNICKYSSAILVDSVFGKKQVIECYPGVNENKIFPLPYIVPKYIQHGNPNIERLRKSLPLKYLFYPAQFWQHKNHVRLLEAISIVKRKFPDIRIVFVGGKKNAYPQAEEAIRRLKLQESVVYLGYVEDELMPTLYKNARALVMPTFFGPTNIPPLEAFAMECPVAISGIYGMKEQCKDAALYFDPKSVEEIAAAIEKLWSDDFLCEELRKKGKNIVDKWGQKQFNMKFAEMLESISYSN